MVEHLFRQQSGKMSAILTRIFGFQHTELVEDIIQETFLTAMKTWAVKGKPEDPEAWLMLVAKNKLINELKRAKRHAEKNEQLHFEKVEDKLDELFLDNEIKDSQLRVLFACCHPALKTKSRIMLTLKVLSGFSDAEIGSALLMKSGAVKKGIFRAKKAIQQREGENLGIPFLSEVSDRIDTVLTIIYLIFNEGYKRSHSNEVISEDLCYEALRLATLVLEIPEIDRGKVSALVALMYLTIARFPARINQVGEMIDLEHQDRSLWDQKMIQAGFYYLKESRQSKKLSKFHLESSIASLHCMAPSYEETDWSSIVYCYRKLLEMDHSDVIQLNYIIALSRLEGPGAGLAELEKLEETVSEKKALIYASKAEMNARLGNFEKAKSYYRVALDYSHSEADRVFIGKKIVECDTLNINEN